MEEDRYGTKQLIQGKKEALGERIEQIKIETEEEPKKENEKIYRLLMENYKQALGPHTSSDDGRVAIYSLLLAEYTKSIIKGCLQVFAEVQVAEFDELVKGKQEDDCNN